MNCLKKCLQASCTSVNVTSSECRMAPTSHRLELAVARVLSRLAGACQDHSCKLGTTCKPSDSGSYSCIRRIETPHCSNNFHEIQKCRFLHRHEPKKTPNVNICGNICVHNTSFLCGGFSYSQVNQDCRLIHHHRHLLDLHCTNNDRFDSYGRDCYFV
ncbi:uncharacterized protein [Haliotis asinina]|uniref:uncharacterized protein n=1 Tax=Haliotis asinina TaxID=109174 RepID=UPI003532072A